MTRKDHIVVANVMVIDLRQETMALSVINQLVGAVAELDTIAKIYKYKGFHEGHHFILIAIEVHNSFGHDMDCFIRECTCFFHDGQSGGHSSLSFCIQFCM
jgi:hypothetical protein